MAHLILGVAVVILVMLSFINLEGNHMPFLLVFLLVVSLNAVSDIFEYKTWSRDKKEFRLGILQLALAVDLGVLDVLSVISTWT